MPCVFLRNLPERFDFLISSRKSEASAAKMYKEIAEAAGCEVDQVEIHLSNEIFTLLKPDGKVCQCPNVHGEVEWFGKENRGQEVKQKIANAIQQFLNDCLSGEGFDLTFRDSSAGAFYVEKYGKCQMVDGGESLPSYNDIAQTVYLALGVQTPGVTTNG